MQGANNGHILWVIAVVATLSAVCGRAERMTMRAQDGENVTQSPSTVVYVHLVPHSHDDVGWLKTIDQYYAGLNDTICSGNVDMIITTVTDALLKNPSRRFIYGEQAFFMRWWRQQSDATKQNVKELVASGQLEFVNGGWSQHDEANTFYVDMVDQTTLGHSFLKDLFDVSPKTGWQIDPFGHSATHAALLSAEVGFTGLFFGRVDYRDMWQRMNTSSTEFIWRPSQSHGADSQIFTGILNGKPGDSNYGAPPGFCYDIKCKDSRIQDDPYLEDYNVDTVVDNFIARVEEVAAYTRGGHIMFTMGSDFQYENAEEYFANLDKLIKLVNSDARPVHAFYSTPSEYTAAKEAANLVWDIKTDDFFPYGTNASTGETRYWTGFFSSRATDKHFTRIASTYLQSARHIAAIEAVVSGKVPTKTFATFDAPRELSNTAELAQAVGLLQHHDAITGTEKQHVSYDYSKQLSKALAATDVAVSEAISFLFDLEKENSIWSTCHRLNESDCAITTSESSFGVLLYNPLGRMRTEKITLPVGALQSCQKYVASDQRGNDVPVSLMQLPLTRYIDKSLNNNLHRNESQMLLMEFAVEVPALSFQKYSVDVKEDCSGEILDGKGIKVNSQTFVMGNSSMNATFSVATGALLSVAGADTPTVPLQQSFHYYQSFGSAKGGVNSGPYTMRVVNETAIPVGKPDTSPTSYSILRDLKSGEIMAVQQTFSEWVHQTIRISSDHILDFEWKVGPVPIDDGQGKEVITRFVIAGMDSGGELYTDSNGREMQKRQRSKRPTYGVQCADADFVPCNYYPVTAAAFIKSTTAQLTVLTDRAQGAASLKDGQIEFMIHRRTLYRDGGVGEPLNETDAGMTGWPTWMRMGEGITVLGKHKVLIGKPEDAASKWRPAMQMHYSQLLKLFSKESDSSYLLVEDDGPLLPPAVDILTLQALRSNLILLRLQHMYALKEDANLSDCVDFDLAAILRKRRLEVVSITELSLTGTQKKASMANKPHWRTAVMHSEERGHVRFRDGHDSRRTITMCAMDIKTFEVEVHFIKNHSH